MSRVQMRQVVVDHILTVLVFAAAATLYKHGEPRHQGFDCNDSSIQLPYRKPSISGKQMWGYTSLLPLIPFAITELVLRWRSSPLKKILPVVYQLFCIFYLGYSITLASAEVLKQMTGRLRPHFIVMCQPDVTEEQCAAGYVLEYNCTNPHGLNQHQLYELKKSFPSGHATAAAYSAVFVAYYINRRWNLEHWSYQVKLLAQAAVMLVAFMTSVDRISEHHHHWQDVIAGDVLGGVMAYWVIKSLEHRLPLRKRLGRPETPCTENGNHIKQS